MATDRRVIFGTYVVPTRIDTMEEDSISKTSFLGSTSNDTLSKTLGGKGSAEIDTTQWNDSWTSMRPTHIKWEDLDDTDNDTGNRWEDTYETWNGTLTLGTGGVQLTADTTNCGFLYIKNTGSDKNALISLTANSPAHYYMIIPPGGSLCLRGEPGFTCSEVYVKASHSDGTTIEWIIAQLTP